MTDKLLIHFLPGSRGSFLAAILKNKFEELDNGEVKFTWYKKIHHINHVNSMHTLQHIKDFIGTKILIYPANTTKNLIEINYNHLIKNQKVCVLEQCHYDSIYIASINYLLDEHDIILANKNLYDYWINFADLYSIEYIKEFYKELNKEEMPFLLEHKIQKNLAKQFNINDDYKLINLEKLLNFEITNNLLLHKKKFNYYDNLNNISLFLDKNYYYYDNN